MVRGGVPKVGSDDLVVMETCKHLLAFRAPALANEGKSLEVNAHHETTCDNETASVKQAVVVWAQGHPIPHLVTASGFVDRDDVCGFDDLELKPAEST